VIFYCFERLDYRPTSELTNGQGHAAKLVERCKVILVCKTLEPHFHVSFENVITDLVVFIQACTIKFFDAFEIMEIEFFQRGSITVREISKKKIIVTAITNRRSIEGKKL